MRPIKNQRSKIEKTAGVFLLLGFWRLICSYPAQAVNVPLTIQEAIFPGSTPGVDRSQDPVSVGVPFADSDAVAGPVGSVPALSLTGASAGQFRCLGVWPSGHCKWALVDTLADVAAGGNASVTLTGGSGNFGGATLATDNGGTIAVNTGAATFVIRKANFNGVDQVTVGGAPIVNSGMSQGLVITGPAPGQTTCPPCVTEYSSKNDPNSSATIEENGPVKAVIRVTGNHMDASGNVYMHYTARMYFYKGKSWVKVATILRNADYGSANSFATAYKGLQAYELRLTPTLAGPVSYSIATDAAPQTGTLSGSDSVSLYQGQSQLMNAGPNTTCVDSSSLPCLSVYTTDQGFSLVKNGAALVKGTNAQYPQGWADIQDGTGAGVEIGVYQMAAYWPKSLEFNNGSSDVRIGIWPRENSQPIYQAWPAWSIHDLFLNFHATTLTSPQNDFLRFQHYLVAHADRLYYNGTGVFPFNMPDKGAEDAYYKSVAAAATGGLGPLNFCFPGTDCFWDYGLIRPDYFGITAARFMNWGVGGGPSQQEEFRWSNLLTFIKRSQPGRLLDSAHFYRFEAEKAWAHADGASCISASACTDSHVNNFTWRSKSGELDGYGDPAIACGGEYPCSTLNNSANSFMNWVTGSNAEADIHMHWYGIMDYYFMTGDETIYEAVMPMKDYYVNSNTFQGNPSGNDIGITRALGAEMMGAARFSDFLNATAKNAADKTDAAAVLAQGLNAYTNFVRPDYCLSGFPVGCAAPAVYNNNNNVDPYGISRVRGMPSLGTRGGSDCALANGNTAAYYVRGQAPYLANILIEGILELRRTMGPSWTIGGVNEYQNSLDLAFGISQWALGEGYSDNNSNLWWDGTSLGVDSGATSHPLYNGFRYSLASDIPMQCPAGTPVTGSTYKMGNAVYEGTGFPLPGTQTVWLHFYLQYLVNGVTDWERKFQIALQRASANPPWPFVEDFGGYQIGAVIDALSTPNNMALVNVPITGFVDNGGGNYTVNWAAPSGAQSYVTRWGSKAIVDSLQFDPVNTNNFIIDPNTHQNWWTATLVPNSLSGGDTTFIFHTGQTGLSAANLSVKAYVPASLFTHTSPPLLSNASPVSPPPLPSGTTQVALSLNTNVPAACSYSTTPGVVYSAMTSSFTASASSTTLTAVVTGLSDGNAYAYYVRCQDQQGNTNQVDFPIQFQVGPGVVAPPAPGNVVPTVGNGQVTISWTPVFNATSYNIYWVAGINDPKTGMMQASNNSPTVIRGLTNGTLYTFAVTAVNSVKESAESAKVVATPSASGVTPPGGNPPVGTTSGQTLAVRVYPNPWRGDKHGGHPSITFDGFVANTTIKLFTVSGHKIKELTTTLSKMDWDLTNDSGDKVASGVYLYVITDSAGDKVKGKVAVIK